MLSESRAEVSSKALIDLQENLISLSKSLNELYDALSRHTSELGEDWRDEKYSEFEGEFRPNEKLILELSEKYAEWANQYLQPRIEVIIEIENQNVSPGGSQGRATSSDGISSMKAGASAHDNKKLESERKISAFQRGIEKINNLQKPKPPIPPDEGGFGQLERERLNRIMNQRSR